MVNEKIKTESIAIDKSAKGLSIDKKIEINFKLIELLPLIALIIIDLLHKVIPNKQVFATTKYYPVLLQVFAVIYIVFVILSLKIKKIYARLENKAPLLAASFLFLGLWNLITIKLRLLPLPYFPDPDKIIYAFVSDWKMLITSTLCSLRLLFTGYIIGAVLGLITGILIGWNKKANYWISPLQRVIGPIPATAWVPIALTVFPTSFFASVFLIALGVWFPVSIMTSSGIANVRNAYFEVAKTLGANQKYLIFKVAIPAALPSIFIGLFMGMTSSFLTLIVAEMLGVKAGLGWYINWVEGWADYSRVYASLIVIAVIFSGIIKLIFAIKDKVLIWQRGLIKW